MKTNPKPSKRIIKKTNVEKTKVKYGPTFGLELSHFKSIEDNMRKAHMCGNIKFGHFEYLCKSCNIIEKIPLSCKSRACNKCGREYAQAWAHKLAEDLISVPHRHLVFSLPDKLRDIFCKNRHLLGKLTYAINDILDACLKGNTHRFKNSKGKTNLGRSKKRKKKTIKSLKKKMKFGLITVIHTFGRKANFNPHFHCILTEGLIDKNGTFTPVTYLPYDFLRVSWQAIVLKVLRKEFKNDQYVKNLLNLNYNNNKETGFYVHAEQRLTEPKGLANYLGRYLARPAIAEYRILEYSNDKVTYWYTDTKTKEKTTVTIPVEDFIYRICLHIPHKNFKMVRRFGIYSRRGSHKMRKILSKFRSKLFKIKRPTWVEKIIGYTGSNPLECKICFRKLKKTKLFHYFYGEYKFE